MSKVRSTYYINTIISKGIDGIKYSGEVIKVKDNGRYCKIECNDGDEENMMHIELIELILSVCEIRIRLGR